jgi:hypothetical protein
MSGGRAAAVRRMVVLGPAFVAVVAYVDPGNVATGMAGRPIRVPAVVGRGPRARGRTLVRYLSSRFGLATGAALPERRRHCPRPAVRLMWLHAELVAVHPAVLTVPDRGFRWQVARAGLGAAALGGLVSRLSDHGARGPLVNRALVLLWQ